jgi:Asp-tRNA(Asn)/Glu-tRNA(Gln) amidotransferase A subunit family amidase
MREVLRVAHLFGQDCVPGVREGGRLKGCGERGEVVIGILRSDGNCALLPPVENILTEVANKLRNTPAVKVVELPTPKAWQKSQGAMSKLMGVGGSERLDGLLKSTGEPLVPWMESRFRVGPPQPFPRLAELKAQRAALQQEMIDTVWTEKDASGRRRNKIDAIICPLAAHPVPEIEKYNAVGYTSSFVYLDCPAGNIPIRNVKESDLELGKPQGGKVLSSWDEKNRELWDESKMDRRVYLGTQLSVQIVVPRLQEEKLCQVMSLVESANKQGQPKSKL